MTRKKPSEPTPKSKSSVAKPSARASAPKGKPRPSESAPPPSRAAKAAPAKEPDAPKEEVAKAPASKRPRPSRASAPPPPSAGPTSRRSEVIAEAVREANELLASATRANESKKRASATPPPIPKAPPTLSSDEIEARIRELEGKLDNMIARASTGALPELDDDDDDDDDIDDAVDTPRRVAAPAPMPVPPPPSVPPPSVPPSRASIPMPPASSRALAPDTEPTAFDTTRELLSSNYYLRKWGRLGLRNRSEEVDDFGYDPVYESRVKPFLDFLYEKYFRVEATGTERIPLEGRCLLVANHSGTVPFDGLMIRAAVKRANGDGAGRDVRWLAEDFIFHFPFIGSFTTRIGAVRACQENAERLLRQDSLVAVFPEGMKGTGKLFRDRYRLQRFGRGGFIKLALRTKTPIVPVAVLGGEETQPLLARLDSLGKPFGFPYVPVTPTFPLLGPVGLAPAPTKWRIQFGEPIHFHEGPETADDELLIGRLGEQVRGTIQEMVDDLVRARRSVFFG